MQEKAKAYTWVKLKNQVSKMLTENENNPDTSHLEINQDFTETSFMHRHTNQDIHKSII